MIGQIEGICVGDHIEKVNDTSMVGCRHYQVAAVLKEIKRGDTFSLRLIEPIKSGFSEYLSDVLRFSHDTDRQCAETDKIAIILNRIKFVIFIL